MSTYGDILAVFPELLQEYDIFTMVPRVGGGYEHRKSLCKREGFFIKSTRTRMQITGESRVSSKAGVFYCLEPVPADLVRQGTYFEEDNQIFVFSDEEVFAKEAGFGAYGCQLVEGNTDQQVENKTIEKRTIMDYPI